jgi:methylated-DNA-protein-cysteine methyltransferase-like protein
MTPLQSALLDVVRSIPEGDVMTYGEVAEVAGYPGRSRAVGHLLRTIDEDVPWWRVLGAGDRIVSPSATEQARLLRAEGWTISNGRIDASTAIDQPEAGSQKPEA